LKTKEEKLKAKILEIRADFYKYASTNLKIKDKTGSIVKFEPNNAQRRLIDRVVKLMAEGKPVRIIVLKARQMGFSTAIEALIYWQTATHKNITSMIVAHDKPASQNLYNMFKRYYDNSQPIFQPARKYDTKTDLVFARDVKEPNGNTITKGLNSTIKTGTAGASGVGRSDTVQLLHCSELGEWENGYDLVASLFQTVPLLPGTMIFLESTAKGIGNYFYDEWKAATVGGSVFEHFFFPWYEHEEYLLPAENLDHLTEEEQGLVERFKQEGITDTDKRLTWRRYKLKEMRRKPGASTAEDQFRQEYPTHWREAFLASGRPAFDIDSLIKMEDAARDPGYYELKTFERKVTAEKTAISPLKVWRVPQKGRKYTIGADVAEGLAHGDFSVADIMDAETMETVARWRGHIDPDQFGDTLIALGRWYNSALVGVEINNHGLTTVQRMRDKFYTNLYRREGKLDERMEETTSKLGWLTNVKTKPLMIDRLREAIRDGSLVDWDVTFVSEAMTYVVDDSGRTNAQEGGFDDCVVAKAINLQMRDWTYIDRDVIKSYKSDKIVKRKLKRT